MTSYWDAPPAPEETSPVPFTVTSMDVRVPRESDTFVPLQVTGDTARLTYATTQGTDRPTRWLEVDAQGGQVGIRTLRLPPGVNYVFVRRANGQVHEAGTIWMR